MEKNYFIIKNNKKVTINEKNIDILQGKCIIYKNNLHNLCINK